MQLKKMEWSERNQSYKKKSRTGKVILVARDREKGPEEDWIRSEDGDFPGGPVVQNPSAMQGTRAQSLVREDPTCFRTTTTEACEPTACALQHKKPLQ